eukprot:TRINITY_DN37730_c0_g1_i1.p1 TRINITY_DN37730_c0_g1~~TRINITY_DN37730_c0_g1_i1.p1  ORF type:complete len:191 (+),score=21.84 TRINITY_DN37730_c0_g1_i1:88-660(+)
MADDVQPPRGRVFYCPEENGLAGKLLKAPPGKPRPKLRGSSAALFLLGLELVCLHGAHLGLEAFFSVLGSIAVKRGLVSTDLHTAFCVVAAALCLLRLSSRALHAPSMASLCRLRSPSPGAAVFATLQVASFVYLGSNPLVDAAGNDGLRVFLRVGLAAPLAEELYFRAVLVPFAANRLESPIAACVVSA